MNNRKDKIRWKNHYDIKQNIIFIFEKNLPPSKSKPTGFYDQTQYAMQTEFYQTRDDILKMLKREQLTLEDCYSYFYSLQLNKADIKCEELKKRIDLVVAHMKKEHPSLIELNKVLEVRHTFGLNL
jgi:hypothetical protein